MIWGAFELASALAIAGQLWAPVLQLDGGGVDAGPVEELLVHDGADGAPTLKSDLLSSFPSYRQPGTQEHFSLDPSSHLLLIFC